VRASKAEAIAISLLFSFANPQTEMRVEAALRCLGVPISSSHRILPEFREYERASTTVVNAYLAPKMQNYLLRLEQKVAGRVDIMQSSGGIISAKRAAPEPVRTVLSGPAGGMIGACKVAQWAGFERIIGFDMGGTSTDVFLSDAAAGGALLTRESMVAGVPVSMPMLDIHTAGAGGGSIARFDAGGMLRVGPESAGAQPGPICFGRGTLPTVTDANLLLGRLDQSRFLGGDVSLDQPRTRQIMGGRRRIRRRNSARGGNADGKGDSRDFRRARLRSSAVHVGGLWRRGSAACVRPGPGSPHSQRAGSRHAGSAFRHRHFAGGVGTRLFAHGDAARRCHGHARGPLR
jgi:N-methylhydantoinase A